MLTNSTALFKNIPAVTSINNISSETVSSKLNFINIHLSIIQTLNQLSRLISLK